MAHLDRVQFSRKTHGEFKTLDAPLNSSYVVYNEGLTHDCARVGEHL